MLNLCIAISTSRTCWCYNGILIIIHEKTQTHSTLSAATDSEHYDHKLLCNQQHWWYVYLSINFLIVNGAVNFCCIKVAIRHQCTWPHLTLRPTCPRVHRWVLCTFAIYTMCALGVKLTSSSIWNQQWHLHCTLRWAKGRAQTLQQKWWSTNNRG